MQYVWGRCSGYFGEVNDRHATIDPFFLRNEPYCPRVIRSVYGYKRTLCQTLNNVRFTPESGHWVTLDLIRALAQLLPPTKGAPTPTEIRAALDCLIEGAGNLAENLPQIDELTMTAIRQAGFERSEEGAKYTGIHNEIIHTATKANRVLLWLLKNALTKAPPVFKGSPTTIKQEQSVFNSLIDIWCECNNESPYWLEDHVSSDGEYPGNCHAFLTEVFYGRIGYSSSQIADRIKNYLKVSRG